MIPSEKPFFRRKRYQFLFALLLGFGICSLGEFLHVNDGESTITGTVGGGKLENGWLVPWSGPNYRFFSPLSYFVLDRGYVHHQVYAAITEAYATCEQTCPNTKFRLMECARKGGGRMLPHRTHQTGMSADFMVPKVQVEQGAAAGGELGEKKLAPQNRLLDRLGVWHYLLAADEQGHFTTSTSIDFERMGRHLLALDDAARANGLGIRKVILKINLKDEFFATESGQRLKNRGIYFARKLSPVVDDLHDDHYHVDFKFR